MVYPLARHLTAVTSLSGSTSWAVPLECPSQGREPLCPPPGVTWGGVISGITSEGIPLPSSLLRAHASDQMPPAAFGRPSDHGSVQVVVSPCWQMARPGVISAVLVEVPGPLPRGVPSVHLLVSSQRASASPHSPQVRHTQTISAMQLQQRKDFGAAVIPLCSGSHTCKTSRLHLPRWPIAPEQPGPLPHAMDMWLPIMNCDIATCPNRALDTVGLSPTGLRPCRPLPDCCLPAGGNRRLSPPDDLEGYPYVHNDMLFGAPSRGLASRVPSSFIRPLLGVHVESASGLLARLWPGRTCTVGSHPLGNNDPFPRLAPSPKVSGLPWRDHH